MKSINSLSPTKTAYVELRRSEYIKIYLTASELKVFELKEKRVTKLYNDFGESYNRPNHFRAFMLNLDNPDLCALLLSLSSLDKKSA